jgi:hypothetical protein
MSSIRGTIRISGDALARVREIAAMVRRPEAMWKVIGRGVANEYRKHFVELDAKNVNKLAPDRREHFWAQIRDATGTPELDGNGVSFTINDPRYSLKVYGGTVVPREKKALTIPIHALGYARRASVFEEETGVKLFKPKGKRVLMADLAKDGNPVVIYVLAKSATMAPDPEALPDEGRIIKFVVEQAETFLRRELAKAV